MPAKAISREEARFQSLPASERVSMRKFSVAYVILQFFPFFLVTLIAIEAGARFGYFSLQAGLLLLLALLVAFYFLMPGMARKVIQGIMAMRPKQEARGTWRGS